MTSSPGPTPPDAHPALLLAECVAALLAAVLGPAWLWGLFPGGRAAARRLHAMGEEFVALMRRLATAPLPALPIGDVPGRGCETVPSRTGVVVSRRAAPGRRVARRPDVAEDMPGVAEQVGRHVCRAGGDGGRARAADSRARMVPRVLPPPAGTAWAAKPCAMRAARCCARVCRITDNRPSGMPEGRRRRLPWGLFDYVDRGCDGDVGIARNRAAFDATRLAPAVLRNVRGRSTTTRLFDRDLAFPAAIAPMSPAGFLWHEGDRHLAAAAAAGVPYTLPTESMTPLADIAGSGADWWFQLYLWEDRRLSWELVERAGAAGYGVLLLTVDTTVPPHRAFNARSGFGAPFRPSARTVLDGLAHPRWLLGTMGRYALAGGLPRKRNHPGAPAVLAASQPGARLDGSIAWEDLAELRRRWPGRLLIKGVLRAADARRAVAMGVDGVVVSNHGGRNLDAAVPAIEVLPAIVAAIGGQATILLDSGIRHGADIARGMVLGADAVLLGRAVLYGLAAYGRDGAGRALHILRHEFDTAMALLGCSSPAQLGRELLAGETA